MSENNPLRVIARQSRPQTATRADLPLRMRRLRISENMRSLVRENTLSAADLILPLFVEENISERQPIKSMPGVFRETEKYIAAGVKEAEASGVKSVMMITERTR